MILGFLKLLFFVLVFGVIGFAMVNIARSISDLSQRVDTIGNVNTAIQTDMGKLYAEIQRATADDDSEEPDFFAQDQDTTHRSSLLPESSLPASLFSATHGPPLLPVTHSETCFQTLPGTSVPPYRPRCPIQFNSQGGLDLLNGNDRFGSSNDEPVYLTLNDIDDDGPAAPEDAFEIEFDENEFTREHNEDQSSDDEEVEVTEFSLEDRAEDRVEVEVDVSRGDEHSTHSGSATQSGLVPQAGLGPQSDLGHISDLEPTGSEQFVTCVLEVDDANTVVSALTVNFDYIGMSLATLRKLIKEKELHSSPSTLKKAECIQILRLSE